MGQQESPTASIIFMERRIDLDLIKGFSIIAIIFYHIGLLPYGYLGVDVFLVISGFLIIPPVLNKISSNDFHYFPWLWKRFKRFLPLVVIVCATSLIIGYFVMIPEDYENLAQSSVASEIFANNILLAITSKNYWANPNKYKPLLALWYLGVVAQFFVLFPLIFTCIVKFVKTAMREKIISISLYAITIISFILYLLPIFDFNQKFYYLPFRIWEFCIGACAFYIAKHHKTNYSNYLYIILLILLLIIFSLNHASFNEINRIDIVGSYVEPNLIELPKPLLLIATALLSSALILKNMRVKKLWSCVAYLGKMSLSLFVWHQVILAFLIYSLVEELSFSWLIIYLILTLFISTISYKWIERIKLEKTISKCLLALSWLVVFCTSLFICQRAGVLRDTPEMGVTIENPPTAKSNAYIFRINSYDRPFSTDKTKVLVIGNSFACDFAFCLETWDKTKLLEISYMHEPVKGDNRFNETDYIFIFGDKKNVPEWVWKSISPKCEVYGIGTKTFGRTLGTVYAKKGTDNYYDASLPIPELLKETNEAWKENWGDHFIDFLDASLNEKGEIRIFTPDSMFISFDCKHLAPAGAGYFSTRLGFDEIFHANSH